MFLALLTLLLKVTEITKEHQKWPKISQYSIKSTFVGKGQSSPQELEGGPRSGAVPSSSLQKYRQIYIFRHWLKQNL